MILRRTRTSAELVGESTEEWQMLEKQRPGFGEEHLHARAHADRPRLKDPDTALESATRPTTVPPDLRTVMAPLGF